MRFNSTINNVKSAEWGLNIQQAYLFSWMYELPSWASKIDVEGVTYYFASKTKAVEELPILTEKTDTMYRFYKQLESLGLIMITKVNNKDYIALTDKSKTWNNWQSDNSENNPTELGNKSENNSENNPTYNIYNTNNTIIDKEEINFEKLIVYYNSVFGKTSRVINKDVKKAFELRIKDGYTKEDVLKVIDNASNDNLHKENNFKYVTLEFLSRPKIFERYASMKHEKPISKVKNAFTNQ